MDAKNRLFSAAALFTVAGTLIVVGCTCDSNSCKKSSQADSEYRTAAFASGERTDMMVVGGDSCSSRASEYEYVHDEQLGTYMDTNTPRRIDLAVTGGSQSDPIGRTRTDIYGRKFVDHPDNYEYTYVEQLGVYLDSKHESQLARSRTTDTNLTPPRDMASDTARDESRNSAIHARVEKDAAASDATLVFTPIAREDTKPAMTREVAVSAEKPVEPKENLQTLMSSWPEEQRMLIGKLTEKYGEPTEMSASVVSWKDKGDYVCIRVMKDRTSHHFPAEHEDCLTQTIKFKVPTDMADEILAFNGSLIIDRTRGTLTACCDSEELNTLALNLANDIVNRSRSVDDARSSMRQTALALKSGMQDPYTSKLQFDTGSDNAADPDGATDSPSASSVRNR